MQNLPEDRRRWGVARIGILACLLLGYAGAVTYRAYVLQIERAPALREMAEEQYLREVQLAPKRGTIYDRHGSELAVSVDVDSVWANPRHIQALEEDPLAIAARLSALTGVNRETLERRLSSDRAFVWVKRRVSPTLARRIREAELPGVYLDREARRFYPNGQLASHVLGFANIDGVGIEGVELGFEDDLRGDRRRVPVIRDNRGRVVFSETFLDDTGHEGGDLILTLDKTIQAITERELALAANTFEARAGSVVVMDPESGEVLALANWPTFDPNLPGEAPPSHRRNRAVTDRFEPGSTVKPFTIAAALASGVIESDEQIDCEGGEMEVLQYTIRDTSPHDELMLAQVLALSSNIGTAKIGMRMGRRDLFRAFRAFGFGESTEVGMPGEVAGSLRPHRQWSEMDTATIAFGQGMSLTSVQLATAMSVIANGGRLVHPRIVQRVGAPGLGNAREFLPQTRRRVIPTRIARLVGDMMTSVTGPGGTGPEAAIDGYLVAGKTGTAQKADNVRGGYSDDRYVASFVGFVPAQNPRLVISVVLDEPIVAHYGGVVAGPAFRRIGEASLRHLGVPAGGGGQALAQHRREEARRARQWARAERRGASRPGVDAPSAEGAAQPEEEGHSVAVRPTAAGEVVVPNVVGMTARAALVQLHESGLRAHLRGTGPVQAQTPAGGDIAAEGSTVQVTLSRGGQVAQEMAAGAQQVQLSELNDAARHAGRAGQSGQARREPSR